MITTDLLTPSPKPIPAVVRVYQASLSLAITKETERNKALQAMARFLQQYANDILEANTLDLEASREMAVPELILDWLKLTPERLQAAVQILQRLAELPDPIRRVMNTTYQVTQAQTYCQLMPLGAIALIYESFPELSAIVAGLCIKTGNTLILRGGSEASHSNSIIANILQSALEQSGLPLGCVELLEPEQGNSIRDLITQDQYLNLVIPYGRPSLIQQVVRHSTAPVLKPGMGNCYMYWSPTGTLEMARGMILESHQGEPDPVNAIEKVLIHCNQKPSSLVTLWKTLKEKGFNLRGDAELVADFPELNLAEEAEWSQSYLKRTIAFKVVDSLEEAIAWINRYSSGHADSLATGSYQESRQFALSVNSACTYINASPRFCRNPKQGDSIFLGVSNQKGHRRGLIGLEALTTLKHIIQGNDNF